MKERFKFENVNDEININKLNYIIKEDFEKVLDKTLYEQYTKNPDILDYALKVAYTQVVSHLRNQYDLRYEFEIIKTFKADESYDVGDKIRKYILDEDDKVVKVEYFICISPATFCLITDEEYFEKGEFRNHQIVNVCLHLAVYQLIQMTNKSAISEMRYANYNDCTHQLKKWLKGEVSLMLPRLKGNKNNIIVTTNKRVNRNPLQPSVSDRELNGNLYAVNKVEIEEVDDVVEHDEIIYADCPPDVEPDPIEPDPDPIDPTLDPE